MDEEKPIKDWHQGLQLPEADTKKEAAREHKVAFYNTNAAIYDHDMSTYNYLGPKMTASVLHKYLQGSVDARIFDVGGGTGLVIQELKEFAPYNNADGLDPAGDMLILAQQNGLYNEIFPQYFTLDSDIPSNSYDAISCCGSFVPEHIKSEVVTKMCDIVKPGGYIVIVMRKEYTETDEDLKLLLPLLHQMQTDNVLEVLEETPFDGYFSGSEGLTIVVKKL